VASSKERLLGTIALVALALLLAWVGRIGLDWVASVLPEWAGVVERIGGWLIGLVVVVAVLLPLFRLYGALGGSHVDKRQ
jgi:uncharacterized protein involved in cysteine biosynthesis